MPLSTIVLIALVILGAAAAIAVVVALGGGAGKFRIDIGGQTPRAAGGNDTSSETSFKSRILGLGGFCVGVVGVLLARLWSMQLLSSDSYARQAEQNRTRTVTTVAPRGRILDRNGEELVTNRPSLTVTATSGVVDDSVEVALLANLLGVPRMACRRKIQSSSEGAQSARTVAVDVPRSTVAFLQEHADVFPGVAVEQRSQRSYPHGEVCAHVLGYTGTITADQIKASQQDESSGISYQSGDTTGQAGVEYTYENVLQGIRGEQTVYVDANGNVTDLSTSIPPESGSDVTLTIDLKIQTGAELALANAIKRVREQGATECESGAAVVLDATNGEVLAMASAPSFNPEVFVGGISQDDWDALSAESAGYPLMNRAVSGQFVAASTVKPLSAFAALDYGIATAESGWVCTGYWTGFGKQYGMYCWNHNGHGSVDLQQGITVSCDTVFYEIAKGFYNAADENKDGLQYTFRDWGLGSATGIDLPGESAGRVPDAEWKRSYFQGLGYSEQDSTWMGGDYCNIAIGQGDILVTPLQMACVYMGLANGGAQWTPHVLKSVNARSSAGSVLQYQCSERVHPQEDAASYDLVRAGLLGVIYEESESLAAHFTNLSVRVAGKTGTGEHGNDDPTGWLCCYAPADNPKYVIAAVLEKGGFGSSSAMYVVRDILGTIYDEPDTVTTSVSDGTR